MGVIYVVAQMLGAWMGFGLLIELTPKNIFRPVEQLDGPGVCSTVPQADLSAVQVFFLEFFSTMVLITLCCTAWDSQNESRQDSIPLKIGLAVSAMSVAVVCIYILIRERKNRL